MSKKSYSDIEAEIRQAADAYEAPFDEQAWVRMEALLDREKDKKRRPFFWLWWMLPLLVAVIVAGSFIFKQPSTENKHLASAKKMAGNKNGNTEAADIPVLNSEVPVSGTRLPDKSDIPGYDKESKVPVTAYQPGITEKNQPEVNNIGRQYAGGKNIPVKRKRKSATGSKMAMTVEQPEADDAPFKADAGKQKIGAGIAEMGVEKENNVSASESVVAKNTNSDPENIKSETDSIIKETAIKPVSENEKPLSDTVKQETEKMKKKNVRGFYFIAAAGAEASGVKLFSFDKFTARYGVGLGYQITSNLSVQTGFYASNKKYVAGPGDYKAKEGSYWSRVDITKVDAACRVYEIPLLLRYDFSPGKNTNLFLSAGISSFIMKKEDYHYYYYRYGMPHDAEVYYSGNKHLFSVLRIAPGLQTKLKGSFSLNVSPGIAIPLAGVGEGTVKLYSTDLTIGLKFTPKRKK